MPTRPRSKAPSSPKPRRVAATSKSRVIRNVVKKDDAPFLSSHEEKRQLILAHAANRPKLDPIQRMSLWAGVAICLVFVVGAWAYTVGSGIRRSLAAPSDSAFETVIKSGDDFRDAIAQGKEDGADLVSNLRRVTGELAAKQEREAVVGAMIDQLATSSTTSTPRNPFLPPVTSTNAAVSSSVDSR